MKELRNIRKSVFLLILVLIVGTGGYMLIEKWAFTDALYMTIITISTVGYGEIHPLSEAGKIFSIVLIVCGVGIALFAFTNLVEYLVMGRITTLFGRNKMEEEIGKLKNHFILCGYDSIGQVIGNALRIENKPLVIITPVDEEVSCAENDKCLVIKGDPSNNNILKKARIDKANGLIAVTDDDATNVFIIVSARKLRPDLYIVARSSTEDSVTKLEAVGANRAINPYSSAGERIARIALYPGVSDFIDRVLPGYGKELGLDDIEIPATSWLIGKKLSEAQNFSGGASILAIRKHGDETIAKPSDETVIEASDRLIILGQREQLRLLEGTTQE